MERRDEPRPDARAARCHRPSRHARAGIAAGILAGCEGGAGRDHAARVAFGPGRTRLARAPVVLDRQRRLARPRPARRSRSRRRTAASGSSSRSRTSMRWWPSDSAIDAHAATNTTSVYTAAGIFPMLPEKLSTNLTSLDERDDRLALVVDMAVDAAGRGRRQVDLYRAVVRNHAKLAYNAVAAWLDGARAGAGAPGGGTGTRCAAADPGRRRATAEASRHERGALDLDTLEVRPVFAGRCPEDLRPDAKNRAKELIENFMIAANVVTARSSTRQAFRRCVACSTRRRAGGASSSSRPKLGDKLPAAPDARRARRVPAAAPRSATPRVSPTSRSPSSSCSAPASTPSKDPGTDAPTAISASRSATTRIRPRRTGASPISITQRLLKAALAGRRRRIRVGTGSARRALHEAGGQRGTKSSGRCRNRRPHYCWRRGSASSSMAS